MRHKEREKEEQLHELAESRGPLGVKIGTGSVPEGERGTSVGTGETVETEIGSGEPFGADTGTGPVHKKERERTVREAGT